MVRNEAPEVEAAPQAQLHRALDVIEFLAQAGRPQALAEIAEHAGVPKASTHRLLATLVSRGYAAQADRSGSYRLGIRCLELGSRWAKGLDLQAVASPYMREFNVATQETVHLAVYDGGDAVYIEKLDSPQPVLAQSYVGRRCPSFAVATGRALLAHQPVSEIERVLTGPLPQYTTQTVVDPAELREILSDVRQSGMGINRCNFRDGVCGVAVPIRDHTGSVIAACGACVPQHRFGDDVLPMLIRETFAAAQQISRELGFAGSLVGYDDIGP